MRRVHRLSTEGQEEGCEARGGYTDSVPIATLPEARDRLLLCLKREGRGTGIYGPEKERKREYSMRQGQQRKARGRI